MRIVITIDLPDGCEVHVSADAAQPITTAPPLSTRPDAAPCQCRGECHRPAGERPEWFDDQARRERIARRKNTVMEGRDNA